MGEKITVIIRDLERCAAQNESDARVGSGRDSDDREQARAVAGEQRRMIGILKTLRHGAA